MFDLIPWLLSPFGLASGVFVCLPMLMFLDNFLMFRCFFRNDLIPGVNITDCYLVSGPSINVFDFRSKLSSTELAYSSSENSLDSKLEVVLTFGAEERIRASSMERLGSNLVFMAWIISRGCMFIRMRCILDRLCYRLYFVSLIELFSNLTPIGLISVGLLLGSSDIDEADNESVST